MGDRGPAAAQQADNSNDLTFAEIVGRLWACRALLVLLPLIGACIVLIFALANDSLGRHMVAYHIKLIGIENGQYPNETAFSPADLKSSTVLAALESKFDIPAYELEQAISINYDDPGAAAIERKYQQKLSARGLQSANIDSINTAYLAELSAAMGGGLRIEVNNALLGLSSNDTIALAFAIPATWNETFVKRYRVLATSKLTEVGTTAAFKSLSGTAELLLAGEQLDKIEAGLAIISDDNRLSGIMTPGGLTAEDIENLLHEFRTVHYNPAIAGGFSPSDPVAVSRKEQLALRVADIERQVEGIDRNLARLPGERPANPADSGSMNVPGMEQGAIETVVSLVQRASYMTYTKDLMDKRQKLVEDMSSALARRDSIVIAQVGNALPLATELPEAAKQDLEALTLKYRDLYSSAQARLLETSGTFYAERTTPTVWHSLSRLENMKLLGAASIAGLLAAVLYAMFVPSIRSAIADRQTHASAQIRMIALNERA